MGKSGAFMFFSKDQRFLLKTMTLEDFNAWMSMFKSYYDHVSQNPNSLLARVYGVYSIQMDDKQPVYVLMMGNTKPCQKQYIKKMFDLKGSMVQRETFHDLDKNTNALKDLNLLNLSKDEAFLRMYSEDIKQILDMIGKDVSLVSQFNLMDYSLLFTVAFNPLYVESHRNQFDIDAKGNWIEKEEFKMKRNVFNDPISTKDEKMFLDILQKPQQDEPYSLYKEDIKENYSFLQNYFVGRDSAIYKRYIEAATDIKNDDV